MLLIKMTKATNTMSNEVDEYRHNTRSPSSTPSSNYSHESLKKAKSPSTPLSTPPSEKAATLEPGVVQDEEANEVEVFFSYGPYWEKLIIGDRQRNFGSRKRKSIDDDYEVPIAKKTKVPYHPIYSSHALI